MKGIQLAMNVGVNEEDFRFAQQLGLKCVQMHSPMFENKEFYEYDDMCRIVELAHKYGMELKAIENTPHCFYDKLLLGVEGKERQLDNYCKTIENMGKAGIGILGYHFMANGVWRTTFQAPGRGGTGFSAYRASVAEGGYKEAGGGGDALRGMDMDKRWENYEYFIKGILPAAEAAGVKLAMHPDDPPIAVIDGVPRLLHSVDMFKKAWEIAGGHPNWGLDFCIGTISELGGEEAVHEIIDFFAPKGQIFYCHFRDVQGTVKNEDNYFQECWLGEGNFDPAEVLMRLVRKGFSGHMIDDHVGRMAGDERGRQAHAHELGYIQGLMKMAEYLAPETRE